MYKLIIIDDEEKIASGMAQLFPWQNIGFEVVQVFTSARKALQYIQQLQQLRILPRGAAKRRGGLPDETGGLQRPAGML